jgi:hypothetical protein
MYHPFYHTRFSLHFFSLFFCEISLFKKKIQRRVRAMKRKPNAARAAAISVLAVVCVGLVGLTLAHHVCA